MDITTLRVVVEVICLGVFLGILWWAFSPRRRQSFERIARSVLED